MPKLTDESNFRGDLLTKEEKKESNKRLAAAVVEAERRATEAEPFQRTPLEHRREKMSGGMIDPSEWGLGDIPEPEVLDDGDEVKVTITGVVDAKTRETGAPYYRITLEVADRPLVKDMFYNLYKPGGDQTPKQAFNTKYNFQHFMRAFSLDMSRPFDPESDWIGETAWCIVSMREDKEYGKQNSVRKWITPK